MKLIKILPIFLIVLFTSSIAQAQFWVGPRVGFQMTNYKYQDEINVMVKEDSLEYLAENSANFNVGLALEYTTEGRYSVHTELVYQRIENTVRNKPGNPILSSKSTYNFLSVPVLMRINFGYLPFQFYVNGGPRLAYWLNGKGTIQADELVEFGIEDGRSYKVHFGQVSQDKVREGDFFFIPKSNRLQYAFELGAGATFELNEFFRGYFDIRYTFGHSNMGFNDQADFGLIEYQENIQYSQNILQLSMGVLVGYDPNRKRKGASNSNVGRKKKK